MLGPFESGPVPAVGSLHDAGVADDHEERAVYVVDGSISIADETFTAGQVAVVAPGADVTISAVGVSRAMLFGGDPMDGPRHIWWNFVSSSKERIEQAKDDWKNNRFERVPGDDEYIPLPEN